MLQMETWTAPAHNTIYYLFPNVYARKCKNVICPVHCEFQIRPGQCWNNKENSISSILVNGGLWAGRPVWRTIQQSARVNPHKLKLIMTELNSKFIEMEWPSPVSFLRSFCDVVAAAAASSQKTGTGAATVRFGRWYCFGCSTYTFVAEGIRQNPSSTPDHTCFILNCNILRHWAIYSPAKEWFEFSFRQAYWGIVG